MAATQISRYTFVDSTGPGTGDIWNASLIGLSIYDKIDALFTNDLTIEKAAAGAELLVTISHVSNTAGSNARHVISVAGASGGDPMVQFRVTGAQNWSIGVDNSDADSFKIAASNALGSSDVLRITTAGIITFPTSQMVRAQVYNNAVQSVPTATVTPLTFNTEEIDTDGAHSVVSNTSRLTVPSGGDGHYLIWGAAAFASNASTQRNLRIRKNGATDIGTMAADEASGAVVSEGIHVITLASLVAGDYVELCAFQNSGGNVNVGSATRNQSAQFGFTRLL